MKKVMTVVVVSVLLALCTSEWGTAEAQEAGILKLLIEELSELILRKAPSEGSKQLAKLGGKAAVERVLQSAAAEGGEVLARRAAQYGIEEGPVALRVIAKSPAKMISALDSLTPVMRSGAIRALERESESLAGLVAKYGSAPLEVAAKHPGVGMRLMEGLGGEGVRLGNALTTEQSVLLSRHLREINALPSAERTSLLTAIGKAPAKMIEFLESHPTLVSTAAIAGGAYLIKDDLLGDKGGTKVLPDGTSVKAEPAPGLLERFLTQVFSQVSKPLNLAAAFLAFGLMGWMGLQLWGTWRIQWWKIQYHRRSAEGAKPAVSP